MKKLIIAISVFISLLVGCGLVFIYLKNQEVSVTNKVNDRKLNIALVNEDTGGTLNGKNYNLGSDFTTLLSKDNSSQWMVMSRNIAENRFDNGTVDVIVYIEQQFSDKISQLESFNPEKAKVTYKTKSNLDPVKAKNVELRVGEYLNVINQNVIKMYFSSVVNNLDDAKRNVENIVNEQSNTHTKITQYIYSPSNDASQSIVSAVDFASGLQKNNASFEDAQKQFSDSVVTLLNNTGSGLDKQLTEVKSYFDLQKEIFEKNVLTTNETLKNQHEENTKIVDGLNEAVAKALDQFGNSTGTEQSEQKKLEDLIKDYNKKISESQDSTNKRKTELETLQTELAEERKKISSYYFNNNTIDFKTEDLKSSEMDQRLTTDAKNALAAQINNSLKGENRLPEAFKNMIANTLSGTSIQSADYSSLFAKLQELGALSEAQVASYQAKLDLLQGYNTFVKGLGTTGGTASFEFLTVENEKLDPITETIPLTVQLPQAEMKTTTIPQDTPEETAEETTNTEKKAPAKEKKSAEPKVQVEKVSPKATVSITKGNGDFSVSLVGGNQEIADGEAHQLNVSYSLTPKYGRNTISFTIHIGNTSIPITKTFYVSDKETTNALVKKDLATIFAHLGKIERAAGMVQSLYGAPDQIGSGVNFDAISPNSVYHMYGNISRDDIVSQLSPEQVEKFKNEGVELLTQVNSSFNSLEQTIENMPELKETEFPKKFFEETITGLTKWYNDSVTTLSTEYKKWKDTKVKQLEVTNYNAKSNTDSLVNDSEASGRLYASIETLVTTTASSSKETTANHEAVGTMKTQFDQFVSQVQSIKENVDKTISTTNDLVANEASTIQENRAYSDTFKNTLKNARDGGTTNQNVMNFLSKPIESKKESRNIPISVENNQLWLILAIVGSAAISAVITYWLSKSKVRVVSK